jgi:hypothetical protein
MKLIQVTNCEQEGKFQFPCQASNHEHGNGASGLLCIRQVFVNMALELLAPYKAGICEYGTGTSGSL